MVKVYKASNYLTVPIVVDGKVVSYVSFNDEKFTYRTGDTTRQKALEALPCFGKLFKLISKEEKTEPKKAELVSLPNITDWQDAVELLVKEYGANAEDLTTPKDIKKAAKNAGLSFPNLK